MPFYFQLHIFWSAIISHLLINDPYHNQSLLFCKQHQYQSHSTKTLQIVFTCKIMSQKNFKLSCFSCFFLHCTHPKNICYFLETTFTYSYFICLSWAFTSCTVKSKQEKHHSLPNRIIKLKIITSLDILSLHYSNLAINMTFCSSTCLINQYF